MSEAVKFFDNFREEILSNIHTLMPCRILKFYEEDNTADIQPLFKRKFAGKEPEPMPPILKVPVLKQKVKNPDLTYKVTNQSFELNDIVLVGFCERAIDKVVTKKVHWPEYSRKHALEDAVILGLLY